MAWSVTATGARMARSIGFRGRWRSTYAVSHATGIAQRGQRASGDNVYARVYQARAEAASPADAKALNACRAQLGEDGSVIERAAATGAPVSAIAALAEGWQRLPESTRGHLRDPLAPPQSLGARGPGSRDLGATAAPAQPTSYPVVWGATAAVQVDPTTCGAAVLAMALMMTDPFIALWVTTGRLLADYVPAEVASIVGRGSSLRSTEARWNTLQRTLHRASVRGGLAVLDWPRSLGTPPWRVNDVLRVAGLKFNAVLVDDSSTADVTAMTAHAAAALRESIPVPMYTGGDSRMGWGAVLPRHVVLLTAVSDHVFSVYEPSSGEVREFPAAQWLADGTVRPALGWWSRVCCLVLPVPRARD